MLLNVSAHPVGMGVGILSDILTRYIHCVRVMQSAELICFVVVSKETVNLEYYLVSSVMNHL